MALFRCDYKDSRGESSRYVFAKNADEAKHKMAQKSLFVASVREFRLFGQYGGKKEELEGVFWQLGFGYQTGLDLIVVLKSIQESLYYRENIALLESMLRALDGGNPLSSAVRKHANLCGSLVVALFEIGEKSGFLQDTCELCAKEIAQQNEYKQSLYKAMIYPCILAVTFLCVCFILAFFVIPEFAHIYNDLGANLPFGTQIVLTISSFLQNHIFEILVFLCLVALFLYGILKQKALRDKIMLQLPFVGRLLLDYNLYMYFLGLHYFLKSKIPFIESLEQCHGLLSNAVLQQKFKPVVMLLHRGIPLSECFRSLDVEIANIALLRSGEKSGMFDTTLGLNATFYKRRFMQSLQTLQILVQPLATMIMGLFIAGLAYSIVAPMWELLDIAM